MVPNNSVARALVVIGDRWTQLMLREAFLGATRFETYRKRTGATKTTLTRRLKKLQENGLLQRRRYQTRPDRFEYHLTAKGLSLYPAVVMIWKWETRWGQRSNTLPAALVRRSCGHRAAPMLSCVHCAEEIKLGDCSFVDGPGAGYETAPSGRLNRRRNSSVQSAEDTDLVFDATDLLGDRWSGLVLACQFFGLHRFDEMQQSLGIATNILTDRLGTLVDNEILERVAYQEHPLRYEYRLTEKGRETYPFALALLLWGDRWLAGEEGPPLLVRHETCGGWLGAQLTCGRCDGVLEPRDVESVSALSEAAGA
ncbi:MAG: helix-turn-helix domain-containing protein [Myxococcota bacterium]|jgi:DNA-binding HxlR family transcriptional regulator|nr:helix-turn-helix domain-containing protein [Myxococcota bacterium]